jgi:hypothetical protein
LILGFVVFPPIAAAVGTLAMLDNGGNFLHVVAAAGVLVGIVLAPIIADVRGRPMDAVFGPENEDAE